MSWCSAEELLVFLQAGGLVVGSETSLDLEGVLGASQEAFERDTLWFPFLKQDTDVTRYFDPPEGRLLELQAGLLELTSVTLAGRGLVQNTDLFLMPQNAGLRGLPTTYIEFSRSPCGGRRSIAITGRWGRVNTLPAEVKQAILAKGASLLVPQLQASFSQGLSSWREGDVEQLSGSEPFTSLSRGWEKSYNECVRRYRRLVMA